MAYLTNHGNAHTAADMECERSVGQAVIVAPEPGNLCAAASDG